MRKITQLCLLASGVLLLAACSGAGSTNQANTVTVEAKEFGFGPASLEVAAGQPVNLTLRNAGTLEHDFSVLEFPLEGAAAEAGGMQHDMPGMTQAPELNVAAAAGQSATLTFTPSKPGTYEFFCTVSGHKEAGMTGTLVVKGP